LDSSWARNSRHLDMGLSVIRKDDAKRYMEQLDRTDGNAQYVWTQNGVGNSLLGAMDLNDAMRMSSSGEREALGINYGGSFAVFNDTSG